MRKILDLLNTITFMTGITLVVMSLNTCVQSVRPQHADGQDKRPNIGAKQVNGKNLHGSMIKLADANNRPFCSGFVVDANYAVTAAHCLNHTVGFITNKPINIINSDHQDTGVIAVAVALDDIRDVGFIKGDFSDFEAQSTDFYGEDVFLDMHMIACGYPSGGPKYCTELVHIGNVFFRFRTRGGPIFKGMSGGPVINIQTGRAIGVNSAVDNVSVIIAPLTGVLKTVRL